MRSIPVAIACIGLAASLARAGTSTLSALGWRVPTKDELAQSWRDRSSERFALVRGDFDGDGQPDEARLMVSEDGKRIAVVVKLTTSGIHVLGVTARTGSWNPLVSMGITVLAPGRYLTTCGKGYAACESDTPDEIELRWAGIDFFTEESADSVFYIPDRGREFRRVWLSD